MGKPEQLLFDLSLKQAYELEDFWISSSNRNAAEWLGRWPNWTNNALIINGPAASGKTHLLKIWCKTSNALEISTHDEVDDIEPNIKNVAIDGLDDFIGDATREKMLFHIYNLVKENKGTILITVRKTVKEMEFKVPDLKTRLLASDTVSIAQPDEELMTILFGKIFSDKQLSVPAEVIEYIVPRAERSFNAIKTLADAIDRKAMAEKKPVTIPMVKNLLEEGK